MTRQHLDDYSVLVAPKLRRGSSCWCHHIDAIAWQQGTRESDNTSTRHRDGAFVFRTTAASVLLHRPFLEQGVLSI